MRGSQGRAPQGMAIERVDVGSTIARATSDRREAGARSASADDTAGADDTKCTAAGQARLGSVFAAGPNHGRGASIPVVPSVPRLGSAGLPCLFRCPYEEIRRLLDLTRRNVIGAINPTTAFQASFLLAAADFAVENERASYSQTSGQQTDNLRQINAGFH